MRTILRTVGLLLVVLFSFYGTCPPTTPTALRVNDPTGDPFANTTQSETSVAITGSTIVVGFNDSGQFATTNSFTGYAFSTDGGTTFTDAGVLAPVAGGSNSGDPALAVDGAGTFFFATLASDALGNSRIGVARSTSTSPTVTFSAPVLLAGLQANGFQDKELIAVDDTGSPMAGNVYVVWTEFWPPPLYPNTVILFSRSVDGGITYSAPVTLSTAGAGVQGAMPAVGPNGELYVAWEQFGATTTIRVRASNDGGATWGAESTAATFTPKQNAVATATCGRRALNGNIRVADFPSIGVDRSGGAANGNVYITYSADPNGNPATGDGADVFVTQSPPGGTGPWANTNITSGAAITGGDGTQNDNWLPFLHVSPAGTVEVIFYDRRGDAANLSTRLFRARSTDAGATWTHSAVSAAFGIPPLAPNFDPLVAACYMGDYNYATSDAPDYLSVWADNTRLIPATGRPDPDVYFVRLVP